MNKRVLVRAYTALNLGDDLFLKILFERYPKTNFILIAPKSYNRILSSYKNIEIIPPPTFSFWDKIINKINKYLLQDKNKRYTNLWNNFFKTLVNQIDAYLVIGGSMYMQSSTQEDISHNEIINSLAVKCFSTKPKYIIGANFGPFKSQFFFNFYSSIFKEYKDICFREQYSKELFSFLENVRCCPDIVFQLQLPYIKKENKSVGFSLIDLSNRFELKKHEIAYIKTICELIYSYLKKGYRPYLFSFCKEEGDERCIESVLKNFPDSIRSRVKTTFYNGNISSFLETYGSMEIMFSTRFHSMILSILFKQKFFPLIYSDKMINILKDLDYKGVYSKIDNLETLDIDTIISIEEFNNISIDHLSKKSEEGFKFLDDYLENN